LPSLRARPMSARVRPDSVCFSSPAHAIVMRNIAAPVGVVVLYARLLEGAQSAGPGPVAPG